MSAWRKYVFVSFLLAFCWPLTSCQRLSRAKSVASNSMAYYMGGGGYADRSYSANATELTGRAEESQAATPQAGRKMIRTGGLSLLVNDVPASVDKVRTTVESMGGYVEKASQTHTGIHRASLVLRVPAARLEDAMGKIKALAVRVDGDNIEARDVTREFIDLDARLRNSQAEEARYLEIMKRASSVKDTLEVAQKLSDVRGRIERMQGELNYLNSQIAMSTLEVNLTAEADVTVMGLHWRPLRNAKAAFVDMVQGLADWFDYVVAFIIDLPLILVWLVSILLLLAVAWRVIKFVWKKLFPNAPMLPSWLRRKKATEASGT